MSSRSRVAPARRLAARPTREEARPEGASAAIEAARITGFEPALLLAIAWIESRMDADADNEDSTARGMLQFTHDAWAEAILRHGPRHGLSEFAAAIERTPGGGIAIQPQVKRTLMSLRDDMQLSALMAAESLKAQRELVEGWIGRRLREPEIYMVHLLGPSGAARFITTADRHPRTPSSVVVPAAVENNKGLFVRKGRVRSVGEAHRFISALVENCRQRFAALLADGPENMLAAMHEVREQSREP